jgi:hypothetical protein
MAVATFTYALGRTLGVSRGVAHLVVAIPLEALDGVQPAGSRPHPPARDTARGIQSKDG